MPVNPLDSGRGRFGASQYKNTTILELLVALMGYIWFDAHNGSLNPVALVQIRNAIQKGARDLAVGGKEAILLLGMSKNAGGFGDPKLFVRLLGNEL